MVNTKKAQEHLSLGQNFFYENPPDIQSALNEFKQTIELAPEWSEGYGWLSNALQEQERFEEAIHACHKAMLLAPKDARYPISLGVLFIHEQNYDSAIKLLRRGISLQPHYGEADARLYLADALVAIGQKQEAIEEWKAILLLKPIYPSYDEPHKEARQLLKDYKEE